MKKRKKKNACFVLDTRCAKGKMLEQLQAQGAQVLDLEIMAQHRGSVLGEDPETAYKQPSQKLFDTRIWEQARNFDRSRPIFVEGESSMIGRVQIPKNTWAGMRVGSVTLLEVPTASRVAWIRSGQGPCASSSASLSHHIFWEAFKPLVCICFIAHHRSKTRIHLSYTYFTSAVTRV